MNTDANGSAASSEANRFRDTLEGLILGEISNDVLVERAYNLIDSLAERPDPNEFTPRWYKRCTTKVNKILEGMLAFSPKCGGKEGQRYTACAIIACTAGSKSSEGTHIDLTDLAISWFSNFLWIFKANSLYGTQGQMEAVSGQSTPTLHHTVSFHLDGGAPVTRSRIMREKVLTRQGRMCAITRIADESHENASSGLLATATLECVHILKHAVAILLSATSTSDADRDKHRFAMSTLDILAMYTSLNHEEVAEIVKNIDSPSNGIIMEYNWHTSFDQFNVCLMPVDNKDNTYTPKKFRLCWPAGLEPRSSEVVFIDHSGEGIELPRVEFIKLHAALCGIFHMSGAGEDIDNLLNYLDKSGGGLWADVFKSGTCFLDHMELCESVSSMLGGG